MAQRFPTCLQEFKKMKTNYELECLRFRNVENTVKTSKTHLSTSEEIWQFASGSISESLGGGTHINPQVFQCIWQLRFGTAQMIHLFQLTAPKQLPEPEDCRSCKELSTNLRIDVGFKNLFEPQSLRKVFAKPVKIHRLEGFWVDVNLRSCNRMRLFLDYWNWIDRLKNLLFVLIILKQSQTPAVWRAFPFSKWCTNGKKVFRCDKWF